MNKQLYRFFYFFLSALIIQGCATLPSDVVMPQWDTDLNVPIATKSYTLDDIIKSQNYISINASQDSVYMINSDTLSQTISVGNFIKVPTAKSSTLTFPALSTDSLVTSLDFPEGAKLQAAVFDSGEVKITGHNPSPSSVTISVRFPGILNSGGTQLNLLVVIPPGSVASNSANLKGWHYKEPSNKPVYNQGTLDLVVKATGSGQIVSLDIITSDFVFTSVTGYLPTKPLGTNNNNLNLNLGDATKYRDKVFLKTATFTLNGNYKSSSLKPFIVKISNLKIQGIRNSTGASMFLSFNSPIDTFRFDSKGNLPTQSYKESNSNITSFITFLPDVINIKADYAMNPDDSQDYCTATNTDSVFFTTSFSTSSSLAIAQTSFSDTLAFDISQDSRDQILKGQGVSAFVDIQNGIPLTAWVKVTLTDEHYHPLFVITKSTAGADSITLDGGSFDATTTVTSPIISHTTVSLDSTQIRILAQQAHYAVISVTVKTSGVNNTPVLVRAKDWIKLNVYGSVKYRINGDKK